MSKGLPIRAFFDELADAIANPSPSRPLRDAVGKQGRKVCDAASVVPPWLRELPGLQRDLIFATCAPYWESAGISAPVAAPPFTGGQCVGSLYFVQWQATLPGGVVVGQGIGNQPGKIVGGRRVREGNRTKFLVTVAGGSPGGSYDVVGSDDLDPGNVITFSGITVTIGSGPNNCGDPPSVVGPGPNPAPSPVPVPVEEQPFDDPESGPILPIPDIPTIPGLPGLPWRNPFGVGDPSTGIPGDPGTPGDPVDTTGPGDSAEGAADPGSELVALKLTLVATPPFSQPLQNDVFRSVAFIYMGTVAGLDQDAAGALVRDGQLVYAERSGLTKWRVAANVGFTVRVTPFYQEVN